MVFQRGAILSWKLVCIIFFSVIIILPPDFAEAVSLVDFRSRFSYAPDATTLDNTLCKVVNALTGRAGKGIATIAVVFLGIGLFMGKMSWSVALATGLGIAAIFGSGTIINTIGGTTEDGCEVSGATVYNNFYSSLTPDQQTMVQNLTPEQQQKLRCIFGDCPPDFGGTP